MKNEEFFEAVDFAKTADILSMLHPRELVAFNAHFPTFHHPGQLPPDADWRTWLIMAGRGFGKTRAGAEWVLSLVRQADSPPVHGRGWGRESNVDKTIGDAIAESVPSPNPSRTREGDLRIALVAATVDEARRVMVEGPSGLLSLMRDNELEAWLPAQRRLVFTNGAEVALYSGANAESLRGPQHHYAWCDELAKWKQAEAAWDNLQLGLRMGAMPRCLVTTTPRLSAVLRRIRDAPDTVETGGGTTANPHLPRSFVDAMQAQYGGTRLGRQELDGEMPCDVAGSLWPVKLIDRCRVSKNAGQKSAIPKSDCHYFTRTVIGVDPPASADGTCGIVVCATDADGVAHVLADCSITGTSPEGWARAVADAVALYDADKVVAEKNQGGNMVRSVLLAASANLPLELVHAAHGKAARAEPVALLFENGRAVFAGHFAELEEQLSGLVAGGDYQGPGLSPDRADACVWALWALMLKDKKAAPRIRLL